MVTRGICSTRQCRTRTLVRQLTFCRRWVPDFRLGSLIALMLPLSIAFFLGGALLTAVWVAFEIPVGPGAAVSYVLPGRMR